MSVENFYLKNFKPNFDEKYQFINELLKAPICNYISWMLIENEKGVHINYASNKTSEVLKCDWAFFHPDFKFIIYIGNKEICLQLHTANVFYHKSSGRPQSEYQIKKIIGHLENPLV